MQKNKALIAVNLSVLLFGMAGLFAKWIGLSSIQITFGRVLISSLTLFIFAQATKQSLKLNSRKQLIKLVIAGMVLAAHWVLFLESIKLSTVAIGTITFSSFPLFVTFLEPIVFREKLKTRDILAAVAVLIGVLITIPQFSLENQMSRGLFVGMLSSLAYAVLTIMNRGFSKELGSITIVFYEQASAAVVLLPCLFTMSAMPTASDIVLLLVLGVVTTALAHTLFTGSLKAISAQTAGIISSMESVYGIILAAVILSEIPTGREIIGGVIIIGTVIITQISKAKEN